MGIRDNELKGDRKDFVLPSIGKTRTEVLCFLEGVEWLLSHLATFRFLDDVVEHNLDACKPVLAAAVEEAHRLFPPFDPPPPPMKKGQSSGL